MICIIGMHVLRLNWQFFILIILNSPKLIVQQVSHYTAFSYAPRSLTLQLYIPIYRVIYKLITIFFIGIYVMEDTTAWSNEVAINHLTSVLFNNIEPYLCEGQIYTRETYREGL